MPPSRTTRMTPRARVDAAAPLATVGRTKAPRPKPSRLRREKRPENSVARVTLLTPKAHRVVQYADDTHGSSGGQALSPFGDTLRQRLSSGTWSKWRGSAGGRRRFWPRTVAQEEGKSTPVTKSEARLTSWKGLGKPRSRRDFVRGSLIS